MRWSFVVKMEKTLKRKSSNTPEDGKKQKLLAISDSSTSLTLNTEWFRLPPSMMTQSPLRKLKQQMELFQKKAGVTRETRMSSYSELRKNREQFRQNLLNIIESNDYGCDNDFEVPNKSERCQIRYYNFIHQGIDIIHVPALEQSWIKNIVDRLSHPYNNRGDIIKLLLPEITEDFVFSNKKSIVDFALHDHDEISSDPVRIPLADIKKRTEVFKRIKCSILKRLFIFHPVIVKINNLWFLQYRTLRIINVRELRDSEALELNDFKEWIRSQIAQCRSIILEKWIPSVFNIITNAIKKKVFVNMSSSKLKLFYDTLSVMMASKLQDMCLSTIYEFTDFICQVENSPGFQVHVLFKNNRIIFNPAYKEFKESLLKVFSDLEAAVSDIPRIEVKLYGGNEFGSNQFLKPTILPEIVKTCCDSVCLILEDQWICPELKIQDFDQYVCLINGQSHIEANKFLSADRSFELFRITVASYHDLSKEIALTSHRVVTIGMFEIHREHFVSILINKAQSTKDRFLCRINETYQNACKRLNEEFQIVKDTLLKLPVNTAQLVQMKEYCLNLGIHVFYEMEDRLRETMRYILFYSDYIPLTSAQIKQNCITFLWYKRIDAILEENRNIVRMKTEEFQELLVKRIEKFIRDLEKYEKEVDEFQNYRDATELQKYFKKSQSLFKKLTIASERIREFNVEEEAFGWIKTVYPKRDEIVEKLSPYKKLYENCTEYRTKYEVWTESKVGTFHPDEIEKDVETFHDNVIELSKQFSQIPAPYALTNSIRLDVEQFQAHMPIVKTLGNPCLKERHWEKISEVVGFPLKAEDLTLAKILDFGLEEYVTKFQVISDSATKESNLETRLDYMMAEWEHMKFFIIPYRDSGTYTLAKVDDIQALLDDHIVKTLTMKNSPYIKPFESVIHTWERKLILLQEIIDAWFCVQKTWLHLEPLFAAPDIQHQMLEESKKFNSVDKIWKDIMKAASTDTTVLAVIEIEKMLERLNKCNLLLDLVQRGLNNYLENKRLFFPRFFFLSNEEMLDIISNTRDPTGVQPNLNKCFDGISKLHFTDDFDIIAIVSASGEKLTLISEVDTSIARGQVEKWLAELETQMKKSVKEEILKAYQCYEKMNYDEWIFRWTQQSTMVAYSIITTSKISKNLPDLESLRKLLNQTESKICQLTNLLCSQLQTKQRQVFGAFLIYSIQIRDILQLLISKSEFLERDLEWRGQLHFSLKEDVIELNVLNSTIVYGCEFTGYYKSYIITPSIRRLWQSLFVAFQYNLGAYLNGFTGIGKTELVKDFSKMCGKHCVNFNCSHDFDSKVIERFFKGIVSSGSWLCLDNLDCVRAQNLQAMNHFLLRIRQSLHFKTNVVKFGEHSLNLDTSNMLFATITHTENGNWSKLPVSMKAYFKFVSFCGAEFLDVLCAKLTIDGFTDSHEMAKILLVIFESTYRKFEGKYCFTKNFRTLENIIDRMNYLKSAHVSLNNWVVLYRAITDICYPMFCVDDWIQFEDTLKNSYASKYVGCLQDKCSEDAVKNVCETNNIQFDSVLSDTVHQLMKILKICTGIILHGNAFSGKSITIKVLAEVLKLQQQDVELVLINPKTSTPEQLYGHQDINTSEWIDGIISAHYRNFLSVDADKYKWLIFDGQIDLSWSEFLRTILDESRALCLKSGEQVPLPSNCNLIFETDNLEHVSPSVISRCCLVYMKQESIKWKYLVTSWLNNVPCILKKHRSIIGNMTDRFCIPLFHFLNSIRNEMMYPVSECTMIKSLFDIYDCFLDDFSDDKVSESLTEIDIRSQLEGVFFFSCIWSLGSLLNTENKVKFDILFRALLCKEFPKNVQQEFRLSDSMCQSPAKSYIYIIPDLGTVFDYQYIKEGKGKWKFWSDSISLTSSIPREVSFHQINIPTKSSVRNHRLMSLLLNHQKLTMYVGTTATGKTVDINNYLVNKLDRNQYKPIFLNFSRSMNGNMVQRLISKKLDKRKKGVYGPPLGLKYVLFVDDLSAPETDQYGVRSSVELLRHWIEYKQWYNLETASLVHLVDLQLICAETVSEHERNFISPRFTRHFNIIGNDEFDDETLKSIFSKIMLWHLDTRGFSKEFDPCIEQLVDATLAIHRLVQRDFQPTISKSHYIFNLRDFSKVIQGVVLSVPEAIEDLLAMKRLWVHEILRVYNDRLVDISDTNTFLNSLRHVCGLHLKEKLEEMFAYLSDNGDQIDQTILQKLLFCDFINPKADVRNYAEVQDVENLHSIVEGFLVEHNNMSKKPMNLVLFKYAIEHISRVSRILKQPQGHALLIGGYGCGRQSLARLAIHICEYEFFQVEITSQYNSLHWRRDLKSLLLSAYTDQHSAFLFNSSQIIEDQMLEDVCHLLQTGQIPEMFTVDDRKEIREKMEIIDNQRDKSLQTDGSAEALDNLFLERVRKQIHVVLVFNSTSDEFRNYLSKFPVIIKCCTMNWFQPWPEDTLIFVAKKILNDSNCNISDDELSKVIEACESMYRSSDKIVYDAQDKYNLQLEFTTKSFIKLIVTFKSLLTQKQIELKFHQKLYDNGLKQLSYVEEQIPLLQAEYDTLQPTVENKRIQVEQAEKAVEVEREAEAEVEILLNGAKTILNNCNKKLNARREEYEKKLAEVQQLYDTVCDLLKSFSASDFTPLKTMKSPPKPIKLTIEALALVKEIKSEKVQDSSGTGKMLDDFWKPALKFVVDPKFIESLISFNKECISIRSMSILEDKIFQNDDFNEDKIRSCSIPVAGIYKWIIALYEYYLVTKLDSPSKLALTQAEDEFEGAKSTVAAKEKLLSEAQIKRENYETTCENMKKELELLEKNEDLCYKKKTRAVELIRLLTDRREVWSRRLDEVGERLRTLIGDILLSAGFLSYMSPLPDEYRMCTVSGWKEDVEQLDVLCCEHFSLHKTLLEKIDVEKEIHLNYPKSDFFYDNLSMIRYSGRWPLFIDPTGVMNSWIKNVEKENDLLVLKLKDEDYLRLLETAIQNGQPVLLEDVGEYIDTILYPVLEKLTFKSLSSIYIKLGEASVEYNDNFRLFISTKSRNPKFALEIFEKITVINCRIEPHSLFNIILKVTVSKDRPDLQTEKNQLAAQKYESERSIKEAEINTLNALLDDNDILANEEAVNVVINSKLMMDEQAKKLTEMKIGFKTISATLCEYESCINYFSKLYQVSESLHKLSKSYEFSLDWFSSLIRTCVDRYEKIDQIEMRFQNLIKTTLKSFWFLVCQSLSDIDKLVFTYMIATISFARTNNLLEDDMFSFWQQVYVLSNGHFPDCSEQCISQIKMLSTFKDIYDHVTILQDQNKPDTKFDQPQLNSFQRFICNCVQNGKNTIDYVLSFIKEELGADFTNIPHFDLPAIFNESSSCNPILLFLFDESDAATDVFNFASDMGVTWDKCIIVSMLETEECLRSENFENAMKMGFWVIVYNLLGTDTCAQYLKNLCETISTSAVHPDFRLWIVMLPDHHCSLSMLQSGLKISHSAPITLRDQLISGRIDSIVDLIGDHRQTADSPLSTPLETIVKLLKNTLRYRFHCGQPSEPPSDLK